MIVDQKDYFPTNTDLLSEWGEKSQFVIDAYVLFDMLK
jgi:hypothetical protein